jgi:Ca2+-binding RTX toxin-like protein
MAYEQESPLINGAPNNTAASTQDTLQGGWTNATLSSSTDVDYFKVTTTSAALIKIDLSNLLLTDTNYWNLSLVDSNGDFVTSLTSTVSGTPVVDGSNTGTTLAVSGLTSSVAVGSRFTFATSGSDTTIYTVTSATTVSSGASTLTLDQALPSGLQAATALVFDPAQSFANGGTTSLTGQVSAAGTYFVKVTAANWNDAEYSVRATVLPTVESAGDNSTKEAASDALTNNQLLENAWMTGSLSSSTDVDVWTFSTATMPDDFTIDFAAATGNQTKPQWKVVVEQWTSSGTQHLLSASATDISTATDAASTSGTSASFLVDNARYSGATTYVVTVSGISSSAYSTDSYKLKVSGTGLDQNDTPILTIDTATSSSPGVLINTDVSRSVKAGADSKVALSSLFAVSDADTGQSISSYKVALSKASGETGSVAGTIKLLEADGSVVVGSQTYTMDSTIDLTAAQMAKAYLLPGTVTGNLTLYLQAFDSGGALDNSGASSVMSQTLRVVSSDVGVSATNDGTLSLQEGDSSSTETLSFSLGTAPTQDVKVYLEQDSNSRFSFGASVLTFTSENFATVQTVSITARDNQTNEGPHTGQITFRVVSLDSQYDGYNLTPMTVAIADPSNHLPTGGISFTGDATENQVLTAVTSSLADADTLGTLSYQWQRSADGSVWSDVSSATASTLTLGDADVGNSIRLAVTYVDGQGTTETVYSAATTSTVVNVNDVPTGSVSITGNAVQNQTLTAANTLADADGLGTIVYQWLADDVNIIGATNSTIVLGQTEVGKVITVTASYTDGHGHAESVLSISTDPVVDVNDAPTGSVTITGTASQGQTLTAANTLADLDGIPTSGTSAISYQWQANSSNINGATASDYNPGVSDIGKTITVLASYVDAAGTHESVASSATTSVLGATIGSADADTLHGNAGADDLIGGLGNDTYYVDTQADLVFENPGEGTDIVIASTSFYLYENIENLTLAAGAGDIFGSANGLDNTMTGNEGANLLLGWDGNDTLIGNAGNDILYGVEGNDSLLGGAGIDVLVGGNGTDSLDGGADADALYGEAGNDILYGGTGFVTDILVGGDGNDILDGSASVASGQLRNEGDYDLMDGGAGNDTYYVDTPADLTFEAMAGGTDTVIADIVGGGYYLYANVENLTLTGLTPYGVGNELDNILTGSNLTNWLLGGAGNDTINGKGGYDVLFGEGGADTFVFERGTGGDVIGDFQVGLDKINIAGIGYTSFEQVQAHLVENGGTTALDLGQGDFVVLVGIAMDTLTADDFVFG